MMVLKRMRMISITFHTFVWMDFEIVSARSMTDVSLGVLAGIVFAYIWSTSPLDFPQRSGNRLACS